jgi:hypothetical protein
MKPRKRGRRPIGRNAMTDAQRQARRRQRLRQQKKEQAAAVGARRRYHASHGYLQAKTKLLAKGHRFERTRREWGYEEGVFVDGALLRSEAVVALAALPPRERQKQLAENRIYSKDLACAAVKSYMEALQVSLDELIKHVNELAVARASAEQHHQARAAGVRRVVGLRRPEFT